MVAKSTSKIKKTSAASEATPKKPLSRVMKKKVEKAEKLARKLAAKTQVRLSRKAKRAAAAAEKSAGTKKSSKQGKLFANAGQAPQSSRISPQRGEIQPVSSRTEFTQRQSSDRKWLVVDAANQTVGRLASEIATLLRGKHKASFTPNNDAGDFVVVVNAEQVRFTSTKEQKKTYYSYSGWIGGMKLFSPEKVRVKFPERILFRAVRGMVPRSPLGRAQMSKLKIYAGKDHPHVAQKPVAWSLRENTAPTK
jgi:large subunit ribosomal protein L13